MQANVEQIVGEQVALGEVTYRVVEDLQSVGINVSEIKKLQDAGTWSQS